MFPAVIFEWQCSISKIMSILFRRCFKTSTFENRKLSLFLVKKEKIFEKRKSLNIIGSGQPNFSINYLLQKNRTSKNWSVQWCDFEILEPIGFHIFSWIPLEKQTFQHIPRDSSEKNKFKSKINISLINLGLIQLHQSRRSLDLLVSRKYFLSILLEK